MKLNIPVTEDNKYYSILRILKFIKPFSELRNRELQVFAELLTVYNKYRNLPESDRNKLTFDYDVRVAIADKYDISIDGVYNIMMSLRKKGLIESKSIKAPYNIGDINEITFKLNKQ